MIAAVLGAILTGLLYWFIWGGGMGYVEGLLQQRDDRKRQRAADERRREGDRDRAAAPLRSITDAREAATVLMIGAALARGVPTPDQLDVVRQQMRDVLGLADDLESRLSYCRYAAEHAESPEAAIGDLAPVLRAALDPAERGELQSMLERVASLHGGPTERQERFIAEVVRTVG